MRFGRSWDATERLVPGTRHTPVAAEPVNPDGAATPDPDFPHRQDAKGTSAHALIRRCVRAISLLRFRVHPAWVENSDQRATAAST